MSLQYRFNAEELIKEGRISRENVDEIKKWLKNAEEKCLPPDLTEEMIIMFLLSCESDVKATKKTITSYFKFKKESPQIYDGRCGTELDKPSLDIWKISSIPKRTEDNFVIHFFKLEDGDYKKMEFESVARATLMLMDISIDERNPPDGVIVVTDMEKIGLMHVTKLKLDIIRKYFAFIQDAMPIKLRAMHYLNSNSAVNKIFAIMKSLIKNDVFDKMHFHPSSANMEEFHKHVPPEYLPKDYGGALPSMTELHAVTKKQFKEKQEFWDMEEKLRKSY